MIGKELRKKAALGPLGVSEENPEDKNLTLNSQAPYAEGKPQGLNLEGGTDVIGASFLHMEPGCSV